MMTWRMPCGICFSAWKTASGRPPDRCATGKKIRSAARSKPRWGMAAASTWCDGDREGKAKAESGKRKAKRRDCFEGTANRKGNGMDNETRERLWVNTVSLADLTAMAETLIVAAMRSR